MAEEELGLHKLELPGELSLQKIRLPPSAVTMEQQQSIFRSTTSICLTAQLIAPRCSLAQACEDCLCRWRNWPLSNHRSLSSRRISIAGALNTMGRQEIHGVQSVAYAMLPLGLEYTPERRVQDDIATAQEHNEDHSPRNQESEEANRPFSENLAECPTELQERGLFRSCAQPI